MRKARRIHVLRLSVRAVAATAVVVVCCCASALAATKPTEALLPGTTKGLLIVENYDQLKASWTKTQLGQLVSDPSMKPFTDDMNEQLKRSWAKMQKRLGIALED